MIGFVDFIWIVAVVTGLYFLLSKFVFDNADVAPARFVSKIVCGARGYGWVITCNGECLATNPRPHVDKATATIESCRFLIGLVSSQVMFETDSQYMHYTDLSGRRLAKAVHRGNATGTHEVLTMWATKIYLYRKAQRLQNENIHSEGEVSV